MDDTARSYVAFAAGGELSIPPLPLSASWEALSPYALHASLPSLGVEAALGAFHAARVSSSDSAVRAAAPERPLFYLHCSSPARALLSRGLGDASSAPPPAPTLPPGEAAQVLLPVFDSCALLTAAGAALYDAARAMLATEPPGSQSLETLAAATRAAMLAETFSRICVTGAMWLREVAMAAPSARAGARGGSSSLPPILAAVLSDGYALAGGMAAVLRRLPPALIAGLRGPAASLQRLDAAWVELCGATCERLRDAGVQSVVAAYGFPPGLAEALLAAARGAPRALPPRSLPPFACLAAIGRFFACVPADRESGGARRHQRSASVAPAPAQLTPAQPPHSPRSLPLASPDARSAAAARRRLLVDGGAPDAMPSSHFSSERAIAPSPQLRTAIAATLIPLLRAAQPLDPLVAAVLLSAAAAALLGTAVACVRGEPPPALVLRRRLDVARSVVDCGGDGSFRETRDVAAASAAPLSDVAASSALAASPDRAAARATSANGGSIPQSASAAHLSLFEGRLSALLARDALFLSCWLRSGCPLVLHAPAAPLLAASPSPPSLPASAEHCLAIQAAYWLLLHGESEGGGISVGGAAAALAASERAAQLLALHAPPPRSICLQCAPAALDARLARALATHVTAATSSAWPPTAPSLLPWAAALLNSAAPAAGAADPLIGSSREARLRLAIDSMLDPSANATLLVRLI